MSESSKNINKALQNLLLKKFRISYGLQGGEVTINQMDIKFFEFFGLTPKRKEGRMLFFDAKEVYEKLEDISSKLSDPKFAAQALIELQRQGVYDFHQKNLGLLKMLLDIAPDVKSLSEKDAEPAKPDDTLLAPNSIMQSLACMWSQGYKTEDVIDIFEELIQKGASLNEKDKDYIKMLTSEVGADMMEPFIGLALVSPAPNAPAAPMPSSERADAKRELDTPTSTPAVTFSSAVTSKPEGTEPDETLNKDKNQLSPKKKK